METKEIINGLVTLNKWRRDNKDRIPMPDPKQIGIWIDAAAERLGKLEGELEQAKQRIAELEAQVKRTVEDRDDLFQARSECSVLLAAEKAAHLATQRALVAAAVALENIYDFSEDEGERHDILRCIDEFDEEITAAREAVAKANAEAATKGNK